ncbi:MAG: DUF1080 domain-containing protein [Bryobacteraceae bacterium]
MKSYCLLLMAAAALFAQNQPFARRWDLTITTPKDTYPSWLEFGGKNGAPEVRIVGRVASAHPARNVKLNGSRLTFSTTEWFGQEIPVDWDVQASAGKLSGTQKRSDGVSGKLAGVPAPALHRKPPAAWSTPEPIFNGKDLSGWQPDDPANNHWVAENGELVNQAAGANIRSTRMLDDFKLHIEYNCPEDGNSGVYLRGRYEIQVEYGKPGTDDKLHGMGSIYGFLAPAVELPRKPGTWESYDVTLVGRTVTVMRDGKVTIDRREIPGITGGAIDSHESEPGPLYIQGDHTGGMKYRNITISVPKR